MFVSSSTVEEDIKQGYAIFNLLNHFFTCRTSVVSVALMSHTWHLCHSRPNRIPGDLHGLRKTLKENLSSGGSKNPVTSEIELFVLCGVTFYLLILPTITSYKLPNTTSVLINYYLSIMYLWYSDAYLGSPQHSRPNSLRHFWKANQP